MSTLLFEVASKLELADVVAMHLVGPVGKAQRARLRPRIREPEVVAHPCGAVGLDRPVEHLSAMFGAATLIMAICLAAALLPTVSIR